MLAGPLGAVVGEGTGGIRVKLNDFGFRGSGTPFVPRPLTAGGQQLSGSR
jgi:hypothetical protein